MPRKYIATLIVDECHDAKNPSSKLKESIASLDYHSSIFLTGTPFHNTYEDFCRPTKLLPGGGPFHSISHLELIFGAYNQKLRQPTGVALELFQRLGPSLIIARTSSALDLPPLQDHNGPFSLEDSWVTPAVTAFTKVGKACFSISMAARASATS